MVPERIERRFFRRLFGRLRRGAARRAERHETLRSQRRRLPWIRAAHRRRLLLAMLVLIPSVVASGFMLSVLPHQGQTWLELAIVLFFGALFGWISIGFWTATLGFFTLVDPPAPLRDHQPRGARTAPFAPGGRTAIVMPICEEPVERVFAGLQGDLPLARAHRRPAPLRLLHPQRQRPTPTPSCARRRPGPRGAARSAASRRIFYRRRRVRVRRKSGNVADFCRRWGAQYRYMIMLDADSVMAGETLVRLVADDGAPARTSA